MPEEWANQWTASVVLAKQKVISLKKEFFRKIIHICSAFVPTFLVWIYYPTLGLLVAALIFYIVSEILRLKGIEIPLISKITETAARKRDENKFVMGPVTLVLGIIAAAVFLPPFYARIGIYALSFGDGLASLCGKLFGRVTIPFTKGKTAAGSLACFTAVYVASFCVSGNAFVSLVCAASAMLIEMLPLGDFDNLLIPISIGTIAMCMN